MFLLLARGRDRLETGGRLAAVDISWNPLLARGRDRLETAAISSLWLVMPIPLLARGRDRLETQSNLSQSDSLRCVSPTR